MALDDDLRNGIALIDSITKSLQATVALEAWIAQDDVGAPIFAPPFAIRAVVERTRRLLRDDSGEEKVAAYVITIVQLIAHTAPLAGFARQNPIDPRDRLTLPDGSTGPIMKVEGVVDPISPIGDRFYHEVFM